MMESLFSSDVASIFEQQSGIIAYLLVFLGGLALNLTPCVYPLIPVTIGIFGGYQQTGKLGRFLHSSLYVLGIATTYSILGMVAALTGEMLGTALQNPIVIIGITLFMVALALSQFGLFELSISSSWISQKVNSKIKSLQSFLMGLTIGLVAAPCLGPFVLGLLTYVSSQKDVVQGFWLFFIFSLGFGFPYLFLAYFSSLVSDLPKSGMWLLWIKKLFGFILIGMALYFLAPLLPKLVVQISSALLGLVSALYLGFINQTVRKAALKWRIFAGGLALLILVFTSWGVWNSFQELDKPNWIKGDFTQLEEALKQEKPILVDLHADWCIPCKELDLLVFTDKKVIALSQSFVMIKIDMTKNENPELMKGAEKYKIMGMPSILFMKKGKELEDLRVVSLVSAEEMVHTMEEALKR